MYAMEKKSTFDECRIYCVIHEGTNIDACLLATNVPYGIEFGAFFALFRIKLWQSIDVRNVR